MTSISSVMVICATPVWGVLTEVGMAWVEWMSDEGGGRSRHVTLLVHGFTPPWT